MVLPDADIPPERRGYDTGSRSPAPARDSGYEAPVNRSQSSITHKYMAPQEVTCCSECDCILDQMKYTCTTCGEKTPTSRATVIEAAAAAKRKGKSRDSEPSSPTQTILARGPSSSGSSSSTARGGYELCTTCFESVGVYHSSTRSINGSFSRTLSPSPQERGIARRTATKRHAFLEQFWDHGHGWKIIEQEETSRLCSGCQSELSGNRFKCGICDKYTLCRACYSGVHENHPIHAFLEMMAKHTSQTCSRSEASDGNLSDDNVDEPSLKHPGYQCFHCEQDIVGARFHCTQCEDININICSNCDLTVFSPVSPDGGHSSSHIMLKIPEPINEIQDISRRAHGQRHDQGGADLRSTPGSVTSIPVNTISYGNGAGTDKEEHRIHTQGCNSCKEPIIGVRYQCLSCPSIPTSFNLCSDCEVKSYRVHNPMHTFLKLPRPVDIPGPLESELPIIPILYRYPAGPALGSPSANISGDPEAYLRDLKHSFALCDRHVARGRIVGKWFRCAFCAKDLCAECEALDTHDSTHAFLVFKAPIDKQVFRHLADLENPASSPPVWQGNIYYPQHK
ncbi:hypothetical protein BJY52DRAFT_816024 [Lactarius psammicola]|nr:hypothetical protein BJY52DRAFT_816024 [Lactarius psammicola]